MRYLLAIVAPPFAILLCKKPVQFVFNLVIWLISIPAILFMGLGIFGWAICSIHALAVCSGVRSDKKFNQLIQTIEARNTGATAAK